METQTVGKVLVTAKIESLEDLFRVDQGSLSAERVRSVEVDDALVDTGVMILAMPKRLIDQLGLRPVRTRQALTSAGSVKVQVYGTVRLTVEGRDCLSEVIGLPDDRPVRVGKVPLALLDFAVDPVGRRLIGNPAHGGEHIIELY
jgi:predicted aspartyl protease